MEDVSAPTIDADISLTPPPSARLIFQPLNAASKDDRSFYHNLYLCLDTCRHIGGVKSPEKISKLFKYICRNHSHGKLLQFKIIEKDSSHAIGVCALIWAKQCKAVEAGIHLHAKYHRAGYGQEILNHLITHAFSTLQVDEILCRYEADNTASKKLVENLPFHRIQVSETDWIIVPRCQSTPQSKNQKASA
ncbi:GNAT family N-acetyltransferase [Thalassotalea sp. PS06]|uniref:GNAT family N-acetyltransferase n=1 Tax=Thalassotalea sp. PS06 TaxID=2594005 RepID=UPI001162DDA2|nr:GNAT family N-acetyltransferase [Thalassotalea sp. PS06]QDP00433.1 GNAT family N-acetyltransferase [Thalassotalea sp. PS06]